MTALPLALMVGLVALLGHPMALAHAAPHSPAPGVLLVSLDGLRPEYVTEAGRHGLKIPYLRGLLREGAHSTGVRGVLPTVTYSSHTTLLTGVKPAKHGIYFNHPFEPLTRDPNRWFWYREDIRVPTLWEAAAQAGYVVGSVSWPVSVGAHAVRFLIPEFAGTRTIDDQKMIRALAGPALMAEFARNAGPFLTDVKEAVPRDWARTRYAVEMIRKGARFVTVHLAASDHLQHEAGPFAPEVLAAIEELDKMLALMGDAIRREDSRAVVCVVSDHGFSRVDQMLKLDAAFVRAGLIRLKTEQDTLAQAGVAEWIAMPWSCSGSAAILLKDPRDAAVRAKVWQFLDSLRADAANGIAGILDREAIARMGGAPGADFWVDMRPGFSISPTLSGPLSRKVAVRGTHGHSPEHSELDAFFVIAGSGIRQGISVGKIDMCAVAPTLAKAMRVSFPTAEKAALDIFEERTQ